MGNLTLPGWGGNLNGKCQVQNIFFFWLAPIKRTWLFKNMEQLKGKDIGFVNNWLVEKGADEAL